MNKQKRQGIADAFRACLPHLWDGKGEDPPLWKEEFICHALEESDSQGWRRAREVVENRLENCGTLFDWVSKQIGHEKFNAEHTRERMQAHRKAWVLKLIEEFEQ